MSRVAVSESVLHWAIDRSGLTVAELELKLPKIQEWLTGETLPTLRQLEDLAKRTLTPLGYLFLDEPPEESLPMPHFRTLGDARPRRPSAELIATVRAMQRRQDWLREYLIDRGEAPLPFVGSSEAGEAATAVAERMLSALGLDANWAAKEANWESALRSLRRAMEDAGVMVVVNSVVGNSTGRTLDINEFRGFVLVDEYAPLAFVNGSDGKAAQMFTLAHELAHVFLGSSAAFDLREMQPASDPIEQACNRIAAEFLVPERRLRGVWSDECNGSQQLQRVARTFKVSEVVVARRALDLGLLSRDDFGSFYRAYSERSSRKATARSGGGDFYANQNLRVGRRFATAVLQAVGNHELLYTEAFRLTGLHGETFDKFASRIAEEGGC